MDAKMTPTLREIAKVAGVSHVTVSRVMRNQPFVREEVRRKVKAVAERLGYRPNPLVGSLMVQVQARRRVKVQAAIGWVNTHPERHEWRKRPYHRHFFEGAKARAEELGYHLDEVWAQEPGMTPERLTQILKSRGIHGLVIPPNGSRSIMERLDLTGFATGFIGVPTVAGRWSYVESDQVMMIQLALAEVKKAGYGRAGLVLARAQDMPGGGWRAGFLAAQADEPKRMQVPVLRLPGPLGESAGLYQGWLEKYRPEVVIGCDVRLKPLAEEAGWSVPKGLGVVHLHLAEDVEGWAGIDARDAWVGQAAVDVVTTSLQRNESGPAVFPKRILVPCEWQAGMTLVRR